MEKMYDVTALGELLIDFTESGISSQGNRLLEVNPGGAPCNVLAMLQKLGKTTAFIGKVGQDQFGRMLKKRIEEIGIDTRGLCFDQEVNTTLTFVEKKPSGDRDFSFYRNPGADMMLTEEDIDCNLIQASRAFHFGTLSMTDEGCRRATQKALEIAKHNDLLITFDPNLRPPLWKSDKEAFEQILYGLQNADVVKIADNELEFMTGTKNIDEAVRKIRQMAPNIKLLCATLGSDGSTAYYKDKIINADAFIQKETIETTGAGDTFCASLISFALEHNLDELTENEIKEMLIFANAAASIVTTRKGALGVMPGVDEVKDFIKKY